MVFRNIKLLGNKKTCTSQEAFEYYREKAKRRDKTRTSEKRDHASLLNRIYIKVREAAIEYEGGVYAPSFFYLIPQPYPQKGFIKILQKEKKYKGTLNLHTGGKVYSLLFVNLLPKTEHKMWDMTSTFFARIKKKLTNTLRAESVRYIFSLHTLKKVR